MDMSGTESHSDQIKLTLLLLDFSLCYKNNAKRRKKFSMVLDIPKMLPTYPNRTGY